MNTSATAGVPAVASLQSSPSETAAVELSDVGLSYGTRQALAGLSFAVRPGEIFGLLGPNGGGKTSLFRILATLIPSDAGRAAVFGMDVARRPQQVRARIGVVFQAQNLDRKLTVFENLRHQGHLYGLRGSPLRSRIDALLARMELLDRRNDLAETLSGGQRRRIELAKGLLHQPALLLLDEPTTSLDPGARRALWNDLRALRASEGATVLFTTHLLEEADGCDRLAILDRGRLVACGTPEALKSQISGEVILIDTPEPELLRERLRQRFSLASAVLGGQLRLEHPQGHAFVPQLIEAFPGEVQAARVSKPTLEDVFIRSTGRSFSETQPAPQAVSRS
jgi:ABC-2 type transport system ATP-binding protein